MADGSHATFSGYPTRCHICGQRVLMTGLEPLWFETIPRQGSRSWHVRCLKGGDANQGQGSPIGQEEEADAPTPPSGRICDATEAMARCRLEQGHTGPHRWDDIW